MVLDLDLFRKNKGGDPDRVRVNVRKRFDDESGVDRVIELDAVWRTLRYNLDQLNKAKNTISKEYGQRMKQSRSKQANSAAPVPPPTTPVVTTPPSTPTNRDEAGDASAAAVADTGLNLESLLEAINSIKAEDDLEQLKKLRSHVETQSLIQQRQLEECEKDRNTVLREIGNLIHESVPISNDEDENAIMRTFGEKLEPQQIGVEKLQSHVDLIEMIEGIDVERGSAIAGSRGYFLMGPAIWLQQALIQYALRFIDEAGFEIVYTPFWMRKPMMAHVAQLSQFDEELYRIVSSKGSEDSEDKYLIATSEQPIAALHCNEWINPAKLPMKYGGFSTCFRQEVGAHGRDTRGIFRVHQFEKIEQFIVCAPANSWEHFHEMIGNSEKFYQSLKIPYRIVNIVSGALNNAAAMKYDLEAWFPGSAAFRELVSVSNCTDYQSRRLGIRYGQTKHISGQVDYVHMLNGTLCAVTRVICAILENYQTKDGIRVPEVLQPYMPAKFREMIPFTKVVQPEKPIPSAPQATSS